MSWLAGEDPEMARAIEAAQASFTEFARQAELENFRPEPAFDEIAIKAFFPNPQQPEDGEHLYATFVATDGQTIEAILDADPYFVPGLAEGQRVRFPLSQLSDWLLVINGRGLGGFTLDVEMRRLTEAHFGHPPYCWYRSRSLDAQAELHKVPVCTACGRQDLIEELYRDGLCGPCLEEFVRCQCNDCGAPLLRQVGRPHRCAPCLQEVATVRSFAPLPAAPAALEPAHDRRGSYRLNRIVGADILHDEDCLRARLFVIDISATGFRATTHFDLPQQGRLFFRIFLEPKAEPIESEARIVWKNPLPTSGTIQFGFEFLDMPSEDRLLLEAFIARERRPKTQSSKAWSAWSPRYFKL